MNIRLLRFKYSDSITNPMEKLIDYLGDIWKTEPIQNVDYNWSNEEQKSASLYNISRMYGAAVLDLDGGILRVVNEPDVIPLYYKPVVDGYTLDFLFQENHKDKDSWTTLPDYDVDMFTNQSLGRHALVPMVKLKLGYRYELIPVDSTQPGLLEYNTTINVTDLEKVIGGSEDSRKYLGNEFGETTYNSDGVIISGPYSHVLNLCTDYFSDGDIINIKTSCTDEMGATIVHNNYAEVWDPYRTMYLTADGIRAFTADWGNGWRPFSVSSQTGVLLRENVSYWGDGIAWINYGLTFNDYPTDYLTSDSTFSVSAAEGGTSTVSAGITTTAVAIEGTLFGDITITGASCSRSEASVLLKNSSGAVVNADNPVVLSTNGDTHTFTFQLVDDISPIIAATEDDQSVPLFVSLSYTAHYKVGEDINVKGSGIPISGTLVLTQVPAGLSLASLNNSTNTDQAGGTAYGSVHMTNTTPDVTDVISITSSEVISSSLANLELSNSDLKIPGGVTDYLTIEGSITSDLAIGSTQQGVIRVNWSSTQGSSGTFDAVLGIGRSPAITADYYNYQGGIIVSGSWSPVPSSQINSSVSTGGVGILHLQQNVELQHVIEYADGYPSDVGNWYPATVYTGTGVHVSGMDGFDSSALQNQQLGHNQQINAAFDIISWTKGNTTEQLHTHHIPAADLINETDIQVQGHTVTYSGGIDVSVNWLATSYAFEESYSGVNLGDMWNVGKAYSYTIIHTNTGNADATAEDHNNAGGDSTAVAAGNQCGGDARSHTPAIADVGTLNLTDDLWVNVGFANKNLAADYIIVSTGDNLLIGNTYYYLPTATIQRIVKNPHIETIKIIGGLPSTVAPMPAHLPGDSGFTLPAILFSDYANDNTWDYTIQGPFMEQLSKTLNFPSYTMVEGAYAAAESITCEFGGFPAGDTFNLSGNNINVNGNSFTGNADINWTIVTNWASTHHGCQLDYSVSPISDGVTGWNPSASISGGLSFVGFGKTGSDNTNNFTISYPTTTISGVGSGDKIGFRVTITAYGAASGGDYSDDDSGNPSTFVNDVWIAYF